MNINRHNYEEFFLLYVDNELKQDERNEVEDFVKQNPDLADELLMLQQVILNDENIEFKGKENLFKQEEGISMSNYEEYFVLSVDNELNNQEVEEVEKFVLKHPELQEEFTLLQKTKLEPENIVFKDKESLYKQEKIRRIIPIGWMRISAAATIIGLVATLWILTQNSTEITGNHFVSANNTNKTKGNKPPEKNIAKAVTKIPTEPLQEQQVEQAEPNTAAQAFKANKTVDRIDVSKQKLAKAKEDIANVVEPDALPKKAAPVIKPVIEEQENIASNNRRNPEINNDNKVVNETISNDRYTAKNTVEDKQEMIHTTAYREIDTNEEERNVYIGGAAINKNKIKSLFKKAAGLFGKNVSKDDEEKTVQVASFQLKGK